MKCAMIGLGMVSGTYAQAILNSADVMLDLNTHVPQTVVMPLSNNGQTWVRVLQTTLMKLSPRLLVNMSARSIGYGQ